MRGPLRRPFHHSDLGRPFLPFAPEFRDHDKGVKALSDPCLFYLFRDQRSSILSRLIDARSPGRRIRYSGAQTKARPFGRAFQSKS
jgi:hypothetical protein